MNVREAYETSLRRGSHDRDADQETIVAELEGLQRRLPAHASRRRGLFGLFKAVPAAGENGSKGLYIWGGVGRGKTYLMDLFYETLSIKAKKRIHFHRMMREVHDRLAQLDGIEDPLGQVAEDMARNTRVLCFDEFSVSDIGDAMLLARLLQGLFEHDVILVTTSNTRPDDLYRNGLQRQRFLPAIELIKNHTKVVNIAGNTDYRLRLLQRAGTYLSPDDAAARRKLQHYFDESASSQIRQDYTLQVNGRDIHTHACAEGIAWFGYADVCAGPRSQNDYIEIARWYTTVIVSGIPVFDATNEDAARRFVALVDEFYDRRVKLIVSADADVADLYRGERLSVEFDRTVSRLIEMQSTEYLAAPHLA